MKITSIWFESDTWTEPYDELDSNMDTILTLDDGTIWTATFFTYQNILSLTRKNKKSGECLHGLYFCSAGMILIERLNKSNIQSVISDLLKDNTIPLYCTRVEDHGNE